MYGNIDDKKEIRGVEQDAKRFGKVYFEISTTHPTILQVVEERSTFLVDPKVPSSTHILKMTLSTSSVISQPATKEYINTFILL